MDQFGNELRDSAEKLMSFRGFRITGRRHETRHNYRTFRAGRSVYFLRPPLLLLLGFIKASLGVKVKRRIAASSFSINTNNNRHHRITRRRRPVDIEGGLG